MIKLIATDMDDTLLDKELKISERNQKAIAAAMAKGVKVMIATGRMFASIKPYADDLNLDIPVVTYNGALVKGSKSGEVYHEKPLKLETALKVLEYTRKKGYYAQAYLGDNFIIHTENDFSRMYENFSGIKALAIGDELYNLKEAPYKLLLMIKDDNFDAGWKDVAETFEGEIDVSSSKDFFLEIMEPGVNKWEAVKAVGESFGIKPEEIMCIGDSNNDLEMIKNAGIGVAVGNAKEEIQKAAKMVTASHDADGVALAIEYALTEQAPIE